MLRRLLHDGYGQPNRAGRTVFTLGGIALGALSALWVVAEDARAWLRRGPHG